MAEILPTPAQQFTDQTHTAQCPCGKWFDSHSNGRTRYCAKCRKLPYADRPKFKRVSEMFPHNYLWRYNESVAEKGNHHAKKGR